MWNTSSQVYFYFIYIFVGERCEAGLSGGKQVGSMDEESQVRGDDELMLNVLRCHLTY